MSKSSDVFLSHNTNNNPAIRYIAEALEADGLTVSLDEWDLTPGRPWQKELNTTGGQTKQSTIIRDC
jgi:hypothetical protein